MEDIFAIDDDQVDVVSRRRPTHAPDVDNAYDEYFVPEHIIEERPATTPAVDDEFNFDYLPARSRIPAEPFDLGLDEEVVVKRRVPRAKLDDIRLLGPKGIPKIRDEMRKKIRFRGKGHELQDLGTLLEQYQFWAHDMFPKAKFRDALKIISKVGKSKHMKAQRRMIITDMLPKPEGQDDGASDSDADIGADVPPRQAADTVETPGQGTAVNNAMEQEEEEEFRWSDMEETMIHATSGDRPAQGLQGVANDIPSEMPMDVEDDLDALEAMGYM